MGKYIFGADVGGTSVKMGLFDMALIKETALRNRLLPEQKMPVSIFCRILRIVSIRKLQRIDI